MYLSHSELEHASGILSDLLRLLLGEVQAPLRLSRVEGDAVISYAPPGDGFPGQLVVDRIDDSYVAFRRALEQMVRNTTCSCNACANISGLDLKFLVHHGEFAVQRIGTQDELVGPEVNFLFRLTKNKIRQALGLPGYVAFTDAALEALTIPGFGDTLVPHVEEDPERGAVTLLVRDMAPVWEERRHRAAFVLPQGDLQVKTSVVVPVPPEVAWGYLTTPERRRRIFGADAMEVNRLADGRIGPDAVYVCAHGDARIVQKVVDWVPPERYAYTSPMSGGMSIVGEFRLAPEGEGTRIISAATVIGGGLKGAVMRPFIKKELRKFATEGFRRLTEMVEEDRSRQLPGTVGGPASGASPASR